MRVFWSVQNGEVLRVTHKAHQQQTSPAVPVIDKRDAFQTGLRIERAAPVGRLPDCGRSPRNVDDAPTPI
jgi:hypothetical protein